MFLGLAPRHVSTFGTPLPPRAFSLNAFNNQYQKFPEYYHDMLSHHIPYITLRYFVSTGNYDANIKICG